MEKWPFANLRAQFARVLGPKDAEDAPSTRFISASHELNHRANRAATRALGKAMASGQTVIPSMGPDTEISLEQQILEGLDRSALVFLSILEDQSRGQDGNLLVDVKTRADHFKMLVDWLTKRKKAQPEGAGAGMPPYEQIRKWLDDNGLEIRPKSRAGRPTNEAKAIASAIMGAEDERPAAQKQAPAAPPAPDEALAARLKALANQRGDANEPA